MARFFSPGVILLLLAFVLSILITISVPYVSFFDMTRSTFGGNNSVSGGSNTINQFRLGIWGFCSRLNGSGHVSCERTGVGYQFQVTGPNGRTEWITSKWTRGLAVQPVASGIILVALILSFSSHLTVSLIASLMSFLGALVTLVVIAINIALYVYQRGKMNNFGVPENTDFGPAFWMNIAVFILTLIAGFFVCFGRHRRRTAHKADTYVPNTAYSQPVGWRRYIPGRRRY